MAGLKIGQIDDGYRYKGGDPSSQDSWEQADSLRAGDIDGDYQFAGGDPAKKENWTPTTAKSAGIVETIKQTGLGMGGKYGEGSGNSVSGIGRFIQAPAASALELITGLGAAVSDEDHKPGRQALARDVSQFAQESRDENVASGNAFAVAGKGMENVGKDTQRYWKQKTEEAAPIVTQQEQNFGSAKGFVGSVKAAIENPLGVAGGVAQSMPDMVIGMGAASAAGRAAKGLATQEAVTAADAAGKRAAMEAAAVPGATEASVAEAANAARQTTFETVRRDAAVRAATPAGSASEAVQSGMSTQAQVHEFVLQQPADKLYASNEYFRQMIDDGMPEAEAKQRLANSLSSEATGLAAIATRAGSAITGGGVATAKTIVGGERMTGKEFVKRTAQDTAEEAAQGIGEEYSQYRAQKQADPTQEYDFGGTVAKNAISGFAMGAGGHGVGFVTERGNKNVDQAPTVPPTEEKAPSPVEVQSALTKADGFIRLGELDSISEERTLTAGEQQEYQTLLTKFNEADHGENTAATDAKMAAPGDEIAGNGLPGSGDVLESVPDSNAADPNVSAGVAEAGMRPAQSFGAAGTPSLTTREQQTTTRVLEQKPVELAMPKLSPVHADKVSSIDTRINEIAQDLPKRSKAVQSSLQREAEALAKEKEAVIAQAHAEDGADPELMAQYNAANAAGNNEEMRRLAHEINTQKRAKKEGHAPAEKAKSEGLSLGTMPNNAEPVTVKNGVVYVGNYPAQDFDSGEDVAVPAGATPRQIRDALAKAGAIGQGQKVFGLPAEEKAPKQKQGRKVEASKDSLFVAIAKLGGMDTQELLSNGFDKNDITQETAARVSKKTGALGKKSRKPIAMGFALPLHKNGGMSFDGMLEALKQYGYFGKDATKNDAIEAFRTELGGEKYLTPDAQMQRADQDQAEHDAMMAAEQDRIDAENAAEEAAKEESGYDDLSEEAQDIADDFGDIDNPANAKTGEDAMRAFGFTEDEINEQVRQGGESGTESVAGESSDAAGSRAETDRAGGGQAGKGQGEVPEGTKPVAGNEEGGKGGRSEVARNDSISKAESATSRVRPKSIITFSHPIVGPSGSKIISYEWQWKPFEFIDARGEDRTGRMSDWEKSEKNVETGRDVVHQFLVEDENGESHIVSAETAIKMLGYEPGPIKAGFRSVESAAKTLARNQMRLAEVDSAASAFEKDKSTVDSLPLPEIIRDKINGDKWMMGDSWVIQSQRLFPNGKDGELLSERRAVLEMAWRENRMRDLGWSGADSVTRFKDKAAELRRRIKKAEENLDTLAEKQNKKDDFDLAGQTPAEVKAQEAKRKAEEAKKEPAEKAPNVSADQVNMFNTQGGLFNSNRDEPKGEKKAAPENVNTASWVIRDRATGAVIMETFDRKKVDALNMEKYEAIPIQKHLAGINKDIKAGEETKKVEPTQAPAEKIEDFGQKIGGARKDVWTSFKDSLNEVSDDEVINQPFSKVWPEPDYQKMIDDGSDAWSVGFMRAARDEVPRKPTSSWKKKNWAEQVKLLRKTSLGLLDGTLPKARAQELLKEQAGKSPGMRKLQSRIELYQLVGHSKSLAGISFDEHYYSLYKGKENVHLWAVSQDAKASAFSNWPNELATGATKDEALQKFKDQYATLETGPAKKPAVSFDIYSRKDGGFWIGKKLGRNPLFVAGPFKTVAEARSYRDANNAELVAKLEKNKEIPKERRDTNNPRVGEDMRNGQDVTPMMFGEAFGFKGVEFGNWVEQKKRQKDLNDAFDALMDMAAVLGIPPKAISLNGELGLAFGARGSGGVGAAAAHYEPGKIVINLTKKEGAGSLGHEWWHALDNYFQRLRGKGEYATEALDVSLAARGSQFVANTAMRGEMVEAFGAVVRSIKETALKARSSKLDAKRSKEYWTTGREMAARAFESYLISKLQDQNASNDYLANIVDDETWAAAEKLGFELEGSYPYPTAGEMPGIRAGFDKFFQTVEHKETDRGTAMFSRTTHGDWYYSNLSRQIQAAPDKVFGPAKQVKAWLQSNAGKLGIKADEIQWTGINDWLDLQQRVTKADVLAYLDANGVQVQEVVKGVPSDKQDEYDRRRDEITDLRDRGGRISDHEANRRLRSLREELGFDEYGRPVSETKYAQYALPGGENYRELLLTLPEKHTYPQTPVLTRAEQKRMAELGQKMMREGNLPSVEMSEWRKYKDQQNAYQQELDVLSAKGKNQNPFRSLHWEEANILAHIRFNDRTDADGARVLFLEELQGDWQQEYRKQSDLIADAVDKDFLGIVKRMEADGVLEVNCD